MPLRGGGPPWGAGVVWVLLLLIHFARGLAFFPRARFDAMLVAGAVTQIDRREGEIPKITLV